MADETTRFRMKVTMVVTGEVFIDTDGKNVLVEVDSLRPMVIDSTLFTHESSARAELEKQLMPYAMDAVLRVASEQVTQMVRKENRELEQQGLLPFEAKA